MKSTVLVFLFNESRDQILLIEKKRGMGAGKWNGPGGKLDPGENAEQAAVREFKEETGLEISDVKKVGKLEFFFPADSEFQSWNNSCDVFVAHKYAGTLLKETEECRCFWWPISQIDFDKFWPDDKYWFNHMLTGKTFFRRYYFDKKNQLLREEVLDARGF